MTRNEFINGVTTWVELLEFCSYHSCDICENVYYYEDRDDEINECIEECDMGWEELRDTLCDIPTGYDYYIREGSFDWYAADDDAFEESKDDVLEWADDNGVFDDDEEDNWDDDSDESVFDEEDDEDSTPIEPESISVIDLFSECNQGLVMIRNAEIEEQHELDKDYANFIKSL